MIATKCEECDGDGEIFEGFANYDGTIDRTRWCDSCDGTGKVAAGEETKIKIKSTDRAVSVRKVVADSIHDQIMAQVWNNATYHVVDVSELAQAARILLGIELVVCDE